MAAGVYDMLSLAVSGHPGTVIAPMTLVDPGYFAEIVGRLCEDGRTVRHFALLAERDTVLGRLRERGLGRGLKRESFAVANWTTAWNGSKPRSSPSTSVPTG